MNFCKRSATIEFLIHSLPRTVAEVYAGEQDSRRSLPWRALCTNRPPHSTGEIVSKLWGKIALGFRDKARPIRRRCWLRWRGASGRSPTRNISFHPPP